jgi:hypothetical protein
MQIWIFPVFRRTRSSCPFKTIHPASKPTIWKQCQCPPTTRESGQRKKKHSLRRGTKSGAPIGKKLPTSSRLATTSKCTAIPLVRYYPPPHSPPPKESLPLDALRAEAELRPILLLQRRGVPPTRHPLLRANQYHRTETLDLPLVFASVRPAEHFPTQKRNQQRPLGKKALPHHRLRKTPCLTTIPTVTKTTTTWVC